MSADQVDAVVVGAGVVGLACAERLSRERRRVVVVERHRTAGHETSSRNSGVIHAGIYYPVGSLKARLCGHGRDLLYSWCGDHEVPHEKTGKLIVAATADQRAALHDLAQHARTLGAPGLELWPRQKLRHEEPELRAEEAIFSPESGVVDVHGLMDSLVRVASERQTDFAWKTAVDSVEQDGTHWIVRATDTLGRSSEVRAPLVINAGGLEADRIAALMGVNVDDRGWRIRPCKGSYFSLTAAAPKPNAGLVYPLPGSAGLGIHLTRDLGAQMRAGPDAQYVDEIDYRVDESRAEAFAESVATYLPGIRPEHLTPDYAGMRPKLQPPGGPVHDFVLHPQRESSGACAVHLIGIESPGLTAALAIGQYVAELIRS